MGNQNQLLILKMMLGTLEGNRECDDLVRVLTSKQTVKLYAMSEEISTTAARKRLESIIQKKSEGLTFELRKNWNQDQSIRNHYQTFGGNFQAILES